MIRVRYAAVLMAALVLAVVAFGQEGNKSRVFTNDDVVQAPPPAPPAQAPADQAPAPDSEKNAAASPAAASPQDEIKKAKEFQAVLKKYLAVYAGKVDEEKDAGRKQRWIDMTDSISHLLQQNQYAINDMEAPSQEVPK